MEKLGYVLLAIGEVAWIYSLIRGTFAFFPTGVAGILIIGGVGVLFIKVLRERLRNREDDYYAKNVRQ